MADDQEEQQQVVVEQELVELLTASFPKATKEECHRFLLARDGSLEGATNQLKDYMEWYELHQLSANDGGVDYEDDKALWTRLARKATAYETEEAVDLPRICRTHAVEEEETKNPKDEESCCCALDGTMVIQVLPAMIDLELAPATTYALTMAYYVGEKLDRCSFNKATVMLDVRAGTGWPNPSAYSLFPFIRTVAKLLNTYHPERLQRLLLYPMPTLSLYLWEGAKPFLDETTTAKIQLAGGPANEDSPAPEEELLEVLDKELLLVMEDERKQEFREVEASRGLSLW